MSSKALTIWSNAGLRPANLERVKTALAGHRLIGPTGPTPDAMQAITPDPAIGQCDVVFGQPAPTSCLESSQLKWLAITSGGYTRYDFPELRESFRDRDIVFTNMSSVFADPCAQHVLGMMLALSRQLPQSWADQVATPPGWAYHERRAVSTILNGQSVLILSFGTIARRLVELLQPFGMKIYALRRRAYSESGVHVIAEERLSAVLPEVNHIVNILPENESTDRYVNARRLALCKPGARFYNVGRGTTVDHVALEEALREGRLGAAYLDVTDPEPLPPDHSLWRTPNCYITPHTAGGSNQQEDRQVDHFIANFRRFVAGDFDAMADRIE